MNILIVILLFFALLGALDMVVGGRFGLAQSFENGMARIGALCLSMMGIYCMGIIIVRSTVPFWQGLQNLLPFDASILLGAILAPDMGGYAVAKEIAVDPEAAVFSGVLLASTLGGTVSFVIPVFLGSLAKREIPQLMEGVARGVVALPVGLLVGLIFLRTPFREGLNGFLPILCFCAVLFIGLRFLPRGTVKVVSVFGELVRISSIVFFSITAASLFFPEWGLVDAELILEMLEIVFRIAVVMSGAMVLSAIVMKKAKAPLMVLAKKLGINEYAVWGLILSLVSSVAVLPLYPKMDGKGKMLVSAFSVSGAFVFGGQFAFIASVESTSVTWAYLLTKLCGGIAAIALTLFFRAKPVRKGNNSIKRVDE